VGVNDRAVVREADGFELHISSRSATGYYGVTKKKGRYQARSKIDCMYLGMHDTAVEAAVACARYAASAGERAALHQKELHDERCLFNISLHPALKQPQQPRCTGVEALVVPEAAASSCAKYLADHWEKNKRLVLPGGKHILGFKSYQKTINKHSATEQRENTLLIKSSELDLVRDVSEM
jgi:hypothetical protein